MTEPKRNPPDGFRWLEPEEKQKHDDVFFDGQKWRETMRHQIGFTVEYRFIYARKVE